MLSSSPLVQQFCTYQNPELGHVRMDVAKVSSRTSHVDFEMCPYQEDRRGDLQKKDFDAQVSL